MAYIHKLAKSLRIMNDDYFEYIEGLRNQNSERIEFQQRRMQYQLYKNKQYTLYGVILSVIGVIILLTKEIVVDFIDLRFSIILIIVGAISFATGIGFLLYKYLQTGAYSRIINNNSSVQSLSSELQDLRIEVLKLRKNTGSKIETENISETISKVIDNTITEDFIQNKIDRLYSDKAIEQAKQRNLLEDFSNLSYRINGELSRLRRSANLNLVIGALTTSLAIIGLGYEVFRSEFEITDTVKLLTHYLPRLSLIIFIEIFAFFFLKLL